MRVSLLAFARDEIAENRFVVFEVTLEFLGNFRRTRKRHQDVVALGLVLDGVRKTLLAPFVDGRYFTAVGFDNPFELFDGCFGGFLVLAWAR